MRVNRSFLLISINIPEVYNPYMPKSERLSRRDFLKLAGLGVLTIAAGSMERYGLETDLDAGVTPEVKRWGRVGPDQVISQHEIDEYMIHLLVEEKVDASS